MGVYDRTSWTDGVADRGSEQLRLQSLGFRVQASGFRVQGAGFRNEGEYRFAVSKGKQGRWRQRGRSLNKGNMELQPQTCKYKTILKFEQ